MKARGGRTKARERNLAIRRGRPYRRPMPISVDSLLATTRATLAVGESMLLEAQCGYE